MNDIRWKQRFQNFDYTVSLSREAVAQDLDELSDLAKEGVLRRFDWAFELAWKTLKDYLAYVGTSAKPVASRTVIKEAFAAQIIADGQVSCLIMAAPSGST